MASPKEAISTRYDCAKFGRTVILTGVRAFLYGGPGSAPVNIAQAYTNCSGMPACGCSFGTLPCPFQRAS
jgi:hypothetical protein